VLARRLRQEQSLQGGSWRHVFVSLRSGRLVLFAEFRNVGNDHVLRVLLFYPIAAAFTFGGTAKHRFGERQFVFSLWSPHQYCRFSAWFDFNTVLNNSITHGECGRNIIGIRRVGEPLSNTLTAERAKYAKEQKMLFLPLQRVAS